MITHQNWLYSHRYSHICKLEQLERLCSGDTPATPWLPILVIHIRSQVKIRQSQSNKFIKIAKNSNYEILHRTLHRRHLLKLLDKMYEYEMDPTRTAGATERTRDAGRMDVYSEVDCIIVNESSCYAIQLPTHLSVFCLWSWRLLSSSWTRRFLIPD